jgi:hypothetical protein
MCSYSVLLPSTLYIFEMQLIMSEWCCRHFIIRTIERVSVKCIMLVMRSTLYDTGITMRNAISLKRIDRRNRANCSELLSFLLIRVQLMTITVCGVRGKSNP